MIFVTWSVLPFLTLPVTCSTMASEPLDGLKTLLLALGGVCVSWLLFPFLKIIKKILLLFLTVLDLLRCFAWAFSGCGKWRCWCSGFSWWWQLLLQSMGSRPHELSSFGAWAQLPQSMWDLSRPGTKPLSPALAGEFFTTELRGNPSFSFLSPLSSHQNSQIISDSF